MSRNISQTVEDRIRRRGRRGRNIRVDQTKAISFPQSSRNENFREPNSLVWNLRYMLAELYGQVGTAVGDISFTVAANTLTVTFANNTGSGVFSRDNLTYTDGTKSWTVDQWTGYYLKVGTTYYKVLSNTATILTLDISKGEWIVDDSYTLVPFIPDMHRGGFLNPDTSADRRYSIISNTETVITVATRVLGRGTVTTGDTGAPYDTFRASAFDSYPADVFIGSTIAFSTGSNAGQARLVTDFNPPGGFFVGSAFTGGSIDVGDIFLLVVNMLGAVSSSEWRTEKYYPLGSSDFTDANPEDIHIVQLPSSNGGIVDSRMQAGYAAIYSAEVISKTRRDISVPLKIIRESVRVELTDLGTGTTQIIYDSGFRPAFSPSVKFILRSNAWTRMDVYLYVADGQIETPTGQVIDFKFDPLAPFITSWRDVTPTVPTNIAITGADTSNNDDFNSMLQNSIEISWDNSIFLGQGGETEVWQNDTEGGAYTILSKVPATTTRALATFDAGTTKWFKIRHVSASGVLGPYSSARKGVTAEAGLGDTSIILEWVDNGGSPIFPNESGWFNDAVLKAKITVTTDLVISNIFFWDRGSIAGPGVDLGSSSPVTSAAIVSEDDDGYVLVLVIFTNGLDTGWIHFPFKYDKTAPGAPTIDSLVFENYGAVATLNSGYSYPSDFLRFECTWNSLNNAPSAGAAGDNSIMATSTDLIIPIPSSKVFIEFGKTLYFWVRARDDAGNVSAWVSSSVAGDGMEITGAYEVTDLMEFRRTF